MREAITVFKTGRWSRARSSGLAATDFAKAFYSQLAFVGGRRTGSHPPAVRFPSAQEFSFAWESELGEGETKEDRHGIAGRCVQLDGRQVLRGGNAREG